MENKFERGLSKSLIFLIALLFILTLSQRFVDEWILSFMWYVSFILSWIIMLVFSFDVLLNKKARGYSIFTAIVTSICFGLLGIHGLSALAGFVRFLPTNIKIGSDFFIRYSQLIFYSSLIVCYFFHMVNVISLRPRDVKIMEKADKLDEEKIRKIRDEKLDKIVAEIDSKDDGLSKKDREILNSHILAEDEDDGSEMKIYE